MLQDFDANSLPSGDLEEIATSMVGVVNTLKGTRILITGSTGFFGTWLTLSLAYLSEKFSLDLHLYFWPTGREHPLKSKKLSRTQVVALSDAEIESGSLNVQYVFHLASPLISSNKFGASFRHITDSVSMAEQLVSRLKISSLKKFVFTSSGAAKTVAPSHHANPFHNLSEKNVYASTKRIVELMLLDKFSCTNQLVISRCFAFVGPGLPLSENYAIGNFLSAALKKLPLCISGDGLPIRSYLYMTDTITYLLKLAIQGNSNQIYELGSANGYSIFEVADLVRFATGNAALSISVSGKSEDVGADSTYLPDVSALIRDTGHEQLVPIQSAISRTYQWHLRRLRTLMTH